MNPRRYIEDLCARYGVSPDFGQRLRPLVERAEQCDPEKRDRLLDLVARSFEQEARRAREKALPKSPVQALSPTERKTLSTVASILHQWNPPGWLDTWGEGKKG